MILPPFYRKSTVIINRIGSSDSSKLPSSTPPCALHPTLPRRFQPGRETNFLSSFRPSSRRTLRPQRLISSRATFDRRFDQCYVSSINSTVACHVPPCGPMPKNVSNGSIEPIVDIIGDTAPHSSKSAHPRVTSSVDDFTFTR